MKFLRLDLLAYGPFTNRALVFPAEGPNFHIVYGPNEAGKSTTLRAITGFLYGIEKNTGDAHVHPMSDLRIGATLKHGSGAERAFIRKKGNQATLLDRAGAVIDESQLRAWLSIADREHFEQMFGLDHEQLREAGAALSDAKTDVGKMLFGASLDGTTLRHALLRLDAEADRLLSPGGNAGAITKALVAYRDHLKRAKELTAPHKDWQSLLAELDTAQARSKELSAQIVAVRTERHRKERLQRALPWLRQREDALQKLAAMGDVQLLPLDVDAQRRELERMLEVARTSHERAEAELDRARQDRDALHLSDALLAAGVRVRQLHEDLGKYKTELRDIPGVVKEIVTYRNEQKEALRQIGRAEVDPRDLASLLVDEVSLERVRVLERQGLKLQTRLTQTRESLSQRRMDVSKREEALAAAPPVPEVAVLRASWEHLRPDKALASSIRDAETAVAALDAGLKAACAGLAPWSGPPDAAPALSVPAEDVIRQYEADLADDARASAELARRRAAQSGELDELRRALQALTESGEPPSERQLAEARERRNRGWELVRRAWEAGRPLSVIDDAFASEVPLVAAYDATVRVADELADALRRDSARAAQYAALQRDELAKRTVLDALAREQSSLEDRALRRSDTWRRLWAPCGFEPSSPREMLAWRGRYVSLLDALRRRDEAAARCESLKRTLHDQQRELLGALALAGTPIAETAPWLTVLLHVEQTLKRATDQTAAHVALHKGLLDARQEVVTLEAQGAECERELGPWRDAWGAAVAKLRLTADASPEEAKVVISKLSELARLEGACVRQEVRLKAIRKQADEFEVRVKALVAELAPDLAGKPEELADGLIDRHAEMTKTAERRRALDEQVAKYERDLDEARVSLDSEQRRFDTLLREAGCADLAALEAAIERSTHARALDAERAEAERRLAEVGEGWRLEELERAGAETDSDRLEAEIAAFDEQLKDIETAQHEQNEKVGALRERQTKFSGADAAASVLAEAHECVAQARTHADRYARLRLATALLRRGVESYRQKNEGVILRRASRLFECLTLGRYQQLCVQYDGEKAKLRCMRGSTAVEVETALSDGTLDQLYLSLRLASLEQHLESQEAMPLVLDDIFIHFDDDRARAGLRVLAELAEKTQVLLFTHHARNLELAASALKPGAWQEHRFDPPQGVAMRPA